MDTYSLFYNQNKYAGWSEIFPNVDSTRTLIIIFAAPEFIHNPSPIKELCQHYPKSNIIGCSTAGEISGGHIYDNSISVAILKFHDTEVKSVKKEINHSNESENAGECISKSLNQPDLKGIFVLSDGLNVNGSELVKGLNTIEDKSIVITGGLSGDGKAFKKTWVIFNGEILSNHIVAFGLYGKKIKIGHASRGGWSAFGPERLITRSNNNVLYELDERPALELYKEYLGEKSAGLPATGLLYPLAIRKDSIDKEPLVRTILSVDELSQSLTFAGDIPQGYYAQLMRLNYDKLITSASEAGTVAFNMILKTYSNSNLPILSIAISCVGRRLLLGERTEEEVESMSEIFSSKTQQIGFYSYGEISPYTTGDCNLHNQTMTVTIFYEQ